MARIEYLRHKRVAATADDGTSDIQPQRDWNDDSHNQVGILGFDDVVKTLSSGAFVFADTYQQVAAETGVTDDLDSLTATDAQKNDIAILRADTGDTITIKSGSGNIVTKTGEDMILDENDVAVFMYDGTNWREIIGTNKIAVTIDGSTSYVVVEDF